jgi:hypothetical protein
VLLQTQSVEITCEVIVGAAVHVSVGVDSVGRGRGVASAIAMLLRLERVVEMLVEVKGIMSILATDLVSGLATTTATTAMTLSTTIKANAGGRATVRVSKLVTGSIGRGLDVTNRAVALDAHLRTHQMGE